MIISHINDLLSGGDADAKNLLIKLGLELGYGSLEEGKFVYCGKLFEQHPDGSISVSMKEYHENLKPIVIPCGPTQNTSSESDACRAKATIYVVCWEAFSGS